MNQQNITTEQQLSKKYQKQNRDPILANLILELRRKDNTHIICFMDELLEPK